MNGQLQSRPSACPHGGEHPCWHLHKAACRGCSHSFIPSSPSGNLNISFHSLSYSIHRPVLQLLLPFCLFLFVPRSLLVEAGGWRVGPTVPGDSSYSFFICYYTSSCAFSCMSIAGCPSCSACVVL